MLMGGAAGQHWPFLAARKLANKQPPSPLGVPPPKKPYKVDGVD